MDLDATSASPWAHLPDDPACVILSRLPLRSAASASAVCRHWRRLIRTLTLENQNPWFFLFGQNNVFLKQNQAFAFDPDSNSWIKLPNSPLNDHCFAGGGGLLFAAADAARFCYSPLLSGAHRRETSPLHFSRLNPLIGVSKKLNRIVVVGGARFIGMLVDIEDRLAVEIYDPAMDSWELGPPLPAEFRSGNSSQWICSAMMEDSLFFVFGIFSSILSAFDLRTRSWSRVEIVRPPGVLFSFLIACRDRLVLAGLCNANLVFWDVNYKSFAYKRIGEMPRDLMGCLFESEDDDAKFASLKCVGLDGLIYVFNEDHHRGYPACVCEIGDDSVCKWRKVPPLPGPVNKFHKVIAFCSGVSLHSVVGDDW